MMIGVISGTSVTYVEPSTSSTRSTAVTVTPTTVSTTSTTPTPTPTPTPTSTSSYVCSTGWFSCALSLGGGCCQNGRTCATGASCLGPGSSASTESASSTGAPSAPVRPTGGSDSAQPTSNLPTDVCPTGFYACQAYYPSGCCRIGRDCQTTGSCNLPTPSSTVVNSNGVTIVAPSGGSFATTAPAQGGSCPSAWYSCPADRGGNCCPEGYSCGEQCTATAGTGVSGKVSPSEATIPSVGLLMGFFCGAFSIGIAMIVL